MNLDRFFSPASRRLASWIIFWGCTVFTVVNLAALAAPHLTIIGVK